MRRWTLRSLATLSLLPFVALVVAWGATRSSSHLIARADENGSCVLLSIDAYGVTVVTASGWPDPRPLAWESQPDGRLRTGFTKRDSYRFLGITIADGRAELYTLTNAASDDPYLIPSVTAAPLYIATAGPSWSVDAPFGPLFLLALVPLFWLPRWAWRRSLSRRRRRAGQCLACGYDVRVASGGDRCPECGAAVSSVPATVR